MMKRQTERIKPGRSIRCLKGKDRTARGESARSFRLICKCFPVFVSVLVRREKVPKREDRFSLHMLKEQYTLKDNLRNSYIHTLTLTVRV